MIRKKKLSFKLIALVTLLTLVGMAHWRSLVVLMVIGLAAFIYYGVFKEHVPVWALGLFVACAAYFLGKRPGTFQYLWWTILFSGSC